MDEWKKLEKHVQSVFSMLLNLKDEGVVVGHNVIVKGRNGQDHQIDVYYQFMRAGIFHRVAIECKARKRPIDKDAVFAFMAKIGDVPGMIGVMVSASGYQLGAQSLAHDNGILAIHADDLPSIPMLLGAKIESVALPDDTVIGEPFWAIYESANGRVTGHPIGRLSQNSCHGYLFLSRRKAQAYIDQILHDQKYVVRGLAQRHFRTFILMVDAFRGKFLIMDQADETSAWSALEVPREHLILEWYLGNAPIPEEPLVMPGR